MLEGDELAGFLRARAGKLTASNMCKAMSYLKNGAPAKERSDLQRALLAERVTGDSVRNFVNDAMMYGLEHEDEAKRMYQIETGNIIMPSVTFDHPQIDWFAATPDSMVAPDGLLECKVPTSPTFIDWILAGVIPEQHKPQMIAQCCCTGRKWVDFVAYDPRVRRGPNLLIRRFTPTADEIKQVEDAAIKFLAELDQMFELFTAAA